MRAASGAFLSVYIIWGSIDAVLLILCVKHFQPQYSRDYYLRKYRLPASAFLNTNLFPPS